MQTLDFEKPIVELENKIEELQAIDNKMLTKEVKQLQKKVDELRTSIYGNLTRWQKVQLARHPDRPYTLDYIDQMCSEFVELHGDRAYADDPAVVSGLAVMEGRRVMIIGQQKGRTTKDRQYRNFGMPNPDGYRKAYRLMELAEKFGLPVITFLDTPGAFPGLEAEERGQGEAIARNLRLMATLKVPILTMVIGEGASGGALGIGMGNEVYMLENTWYSVISPESCSSILWKTWDYKEQAAEALKLTAPDMVELGIVEGMLEEPLGGAHRDPKAAIETVKKQCIESLDRLGAMSVDELVQQRVDKYTAIGSFTTTKK
ncbi:MAG: acetyl-CoA carboxylase carboxyltransferase subunit alpha [Balneolaceae bacterium]|nr:acetyl-CoA carboxylase carboxyltransferase subunit alpha [Balneolaceae bacterium]MDR9446581.1 acetyl-CoA carboxylase carboxyltransferase subunit alpha [Balneolaceae bacterium]